MNEEAVPPTVVPLVSTGGPVASHRKDDTRLTEVEGQDTNPVSDDVSPMNVMKKSTLNELILPQGSVFLSDRRQLMWIVRVIVGARIYGLELTSD